MGSIDLNGKWKFKNVTKEEWIDAKALEGIGYMGSGIIWLKLTIIYF